MSMIPVTRDKLPLGEALPWALYDQDRNLLLPQGEVIASEEQLQTLLAQNPLRELSWNTND